MGKCTEECSVKVQISYLEEAKYVVNITKENEQDRITTVPSETHKYHGHCHSQHEHNEYHHYHYFIVDTSHSDWRIQY